MDFLLSHRKVQYEVNLYRVFQQVLDWFWAKKLNSIINHDLKYFPWTGIELRYSKNCIWIRTPENKSWIAVIGSFWTVDVTVLEVCHFNEAIFDGRWMRALDLWNVQYKLDIVLQIEPREKHSSRGTGTLDPSPSILDRVSSFLHQKTDSSLGKHPLGKRTPHK